MATDKLHLRVITPDDIKYDADADMVIMRCTTGDMGILPNHEPCAAILDYGVLRIKTGGVERAMAVFGGIANVQDNTIIILAGDAQWPEDIDRAHVEAEREKTERRLQTHTDDMDIQRDQVLIRRTLVQIEVSDYPIIGTLDGDETTADESE